MSVPVVARVFARESGSLQSVPVTSDVWPCVWHTRNRIKHTIYILYSTGERVTRDIYLFEKRGRAAGGGTLATRYLMFHSSSAVRRGATVNAHTERCTHCGPCVYARPQDSRYTRRKCNTVDCHARLRRPPVVDPWCGLFYVAQPCVDEAERPVCHADRPPGRDAERLALL